MPDVEIVAECANGFEAVKAVSELQPDLLLLDVQMPKLDGFEVLELVGRDVAVVFITAYDQYALRAFEVHAVDYLLKPFSAERLAEALDRARERLGRRRAAAGRRRSRRRHGRAAGHAARVLVRDGPRVHVMPVEKIDYVQAQDDYVCFRCEGKEYLKEQTLAEVEAALDPGEVRADPPIVRAQPRSAGAGRAGRAREPHRDAHRRAAPAGQPRRPRTTHRGAQTLGAPSAARSEDPALRGRLKKALRCC